MRFSYRAIYETEEKIPPPVGLIVRESSTGPDRLVIWDHREGGWRFNPKAAVIYVMDDMLMYRVPNVDRSTAEQIAREVFGATLPSEEELHQMMEDGLRSQTGR